MADAVFSVRIDEELKNRFIELAQQNGINNKIFFDTMGFLPRFINEHKKNHGVYAFTWAWWFVRQISMLEFRIDDFEFEFMGDNKTISLHIPSDADLKNGKIDVIFDFANKYYPEYKNVNIICETWLLVPELKKLLPENTTLQKNLKQHLLSGGKFGWAYGIYSNIE